MFTGIVQGLGRILLVTPRGGDRELEIEVGEINLARLALGDSIAVNGVCLTITKRSGQRFSADVSSETLACTTFAELAPGHAVNIEPALRLGEPLGGHLVSGHVDGVGSMVGRHSEARSERLEFEAPAQLARYIARKGSICIDGVSLTVNDVAGARFGVNLIPHTLALTTLGSLQLGARVNLEVDLVARYLERLSAFEHP